MKAAIDAVPYSSSIKIGAAIQRRFWEEERGIFSAASPITDLPIRQIFLSERRLKFGRKRRAARRLYLGWANSFELTAMSPAECIQFALQYGAEIHPHTSRVRDGRRRRWHKVRHSCAAPANGRRRAAASTTTSLSDRRSHRLGRRTCLLHPGLAGRRDPFGADASRALHKRGSGGLMGSIRRAAKIRAALFLRRRSCRHQRSWRRSFPGAAFHQPGRASRSRAARRSTPMSAPPAIQPDAKGRSARPPIRPRRKQETRSDDYS